jgi:hypothetical protein
VREDGGEYRVRDEDFDKAYDKAYDKVEDGGEAMFHHETLDVYRGALAAAGVIYSSQAITDLPNPAFRRLDELITSMVLNIAEGNGRFSDADQARFLGTSYESAIKLAARLDLCCARGLLPRSETNGFKGPLERVAAMTYGMIRSVKAKGGQNA